MNTIQIILVRSRAPSIGVGAVTALLALGLVGSGQSWARPPFTEAQLAEQQQLLLAEVDKGRDLWHGSKPSMSTTGLACGNCHPDAAASNPQTFPKYVTELDRVAPLRDMINWCIAHPQGGTQLDVNSDDMLALESYAFYLNRGATITPGLELPTGPYPVKSGVGFPKKPSGIGVDK